MIPIYVNPSSGIPIYMQIINQVRALISSGTLKQDDLLPSVRDMAKFLQINPMTVSKAYSVMEIEKTVYRLKGKGIYISPKATVLNKKERISLIEHDIKHLVYEAERLDIPLDELIKILKTTYLNLKKKEK